MCKWESNVWVCMQVVHASHYALHYLTIWWILLTSLSLLLLVSVLFLLQPSCMCILHRSYCPRGYLSLISLPVCVHVLGVSHPQNANNSLNQSFQLICEGPGRSWPWARPIYQFYTVQWLYTYITKRDFPQAVISHLPRAANPFKHFWGEWKVISPWDLSKELLGSPVTGFPCCSIEVLPKGWLTKYQINQTATLRERVLLTRGPPLCHISGRLTTRPNSSNYLVKTRAM